MADLGVLLAMVVFPILAALLGGSNVAYAFPLAAVPRLWRTPRTKLANVALTVALVIGCGLADQRAAVETDLRLIEGEIANLVNALARGEALTSVQDALRARERDALRVRLDHVNARARLPQLDPAAPTSDLHKRLTDWRGLLDAEPVKARQILRKLLDGRYTFTGPASYGRLLTGVLRNVWCPRAGAKATTRGQSGAWCGLRKSSARALLYRGKRC